MKKLIIVLCVFVCLCVSVLSLDLKPIDQIKTLDNTLEYKNIVVTPYLTNFTKYDKAFFDWSIDEKSFNIVPKVSLKNPLNQFHYKLNSLYTPYNCTPLNEYFNNCTREKIDFSKFLNKPVNRIDKYNINPVYNKSNEFEEITHYLFSAYGEIWDLDPEFIKEYSSTTNGFFNGTEATADGIKLNSTATSGDFKYFIYYNETPTYWNMSLNFEGVNDLTLETRTAEKWNITDNNLIAYFPFENTSDLWAIKDEKGDVTDVILGNGVETYKPTNSQTYGVMGKGYYFDGGDLISESGTDTLGIGRNNWTISVWIKPAPSLIGFRGIVGKVDSYADAEYGIFWNNGKLHVPIELSSNNDYTETINAVANNSNWNFITATFNADTLDVDIYYNGINQTTLGTIASLPSSNIARFRIGDFFSYAYNRRWNGNIDEIRIYNRTLSPNEIYNLYEMDKYAFEWDEWTNEGDIIANKSLQSSKEGRFYQFKVNFEGDDTDPILKDHSVIISEDTKPPSLDISAPIENGTFSGVYFTPYVSANENIASWWYNLNDGENISFTPNTTKIYINETNYYDLNIFANDTAGNIGTSDVYFTWIYVPFDELLQEAQNTKINGLLILFFIIGLILVIVGLSFIPIATLLGGLVWLILGVGILSGGVPLLNDYVVTALYKNSLGLIMTLIGLYFILYEFIGGKNGDRRDKTND